MMTWKEPSWAWWSLLGHICEGTLRKKVAAAASAAAHQSRQSSNNCWVINFPGNRYQKQQPQQQQQQKTQIIMRFIVPIGCVQVAEEEVEENGEDWADANWTMMRFIHGWLLVRIDSFGREFCAWLLREGRRFWWMFKTMTTHQKAPQRLSGDS